MPEITEPRELFVHELRGLLGAERAIVPIREEVQEGLQDEPFRERLDRHAGETRGQIANLEQALSRLAADAQPEACPAVDGLHREYRETAGKVGPDLKDAATTTALAKIESYEATTYRGLIVTAKALGESEVVALLEDNLEQEEGMLDQVELYAKRLAHGQKATWTLAPEHPN